MYIEQAERVRRAVQALDFDDQELVRVVFFEAREQCEVAQALDISTRQLRRRERALLLRLRDMLSDG